MSSVTPKPVKTSSNPVAMLRADLENERTMVGRYRERIRQAEAMGEFALSESMRAIIVQEQEYEIDLAAALGIDVTLPLKPSHIEAGYEKRGLSTKTPKARAWATVNKFTGGGKRAASAETQLDMI
jgi:hypothetical protein